MEQLIFSSVVTDVVAMPSSIENLPHARASAAFTDPKPVFKEDGEILATQASKDDITVLGVRGQDYISLTDMSSAKDGDGRIADVIKGWVRARYTIEFLGTWEIIHNPNFKVVEFDHFRMGAGLPGQAEIPVHMLN